MTPEQRAEWRTDAYDTMQKWTQAADTAVPPSVLHARRVERLMDEIDALAAENARLREVLSKVCVAAAYYGGDYVEREVDAVLDAALNPQENRDASTR